MGNETYHYFGAYLEIKTYQIEEVRTVLVCDNGHKKQKGTFCQECGAAVHPTQKVVSVFPHFIDDVLGDEWEDVLNVITPPSLSRTGVILARSNGNAKGEDWLFLSRWGNEVEIKPFPTSDEIEAMKRALIDYHSDIIEALNNSPHVISVEVKAGYVLDAEY